MGAGEHRSSRPATTAPESPTAPSGGGKFIAGDAIRGLCVAWIMVVHVLVNALGRTVGDARDPVGHLGELGRIAERGMLSVFILFALSGYLLGRPFIRAFVLGRTAPAVGKYLGNRALRIVPVFLLAVTATLLIRGREGSSWLEVASLVGFGQIYNRSEFDTRGLPQAWTLDNEVVFYLVLPLIMIPVIALLASRGTPRTRALAVLCALALSSVISILIRGHEATITTIQSPPSLVFTFAAGMAIATLEPLVRPRLTSRRAGRGVAWGLVAVALSATALWIWVPWTNLSAEAAAGLVACFGILAAPLVLQWATGRCWRLIDNPVMRWIGERSYSLYLFHVLAIYVCVEAIDGVFGDIESLKLAIMVLALTALPLALLIGDLSFRLVERPFMRRRYDWRRGEQPAPEPTSVPVPAQAPVPAG